MFEQSALYARTLEETLSPLHPESLSGRTVLVTGATGLIGTALIDALNWLNGRGANIRVRAAARSPEKARARFSACPEGPLFQLAEYEASRPLGGREVYDYIVHAASNAHPTVYASDPVGTMLGNLLGVKELLEYGLKNGMRRFLYVSSGEVYGQAQDDRGFSEEDYGYVDILSPRSCYPVAKRAAETLCASYRAQQGVDFVVARPSHVYGPTQSPSDSRASAQFFRSVLAGQPIVLKSAGEALRSYCHAADCASALITILLKGEAGAAYNVANHLSVASIAELAHAIARVAGAQVRFENPSDAERVGYTPNRRGVLLDDKLLGLGWRPHLSLEEGVRRTVQILREERA